MYGPMITGTHWYNKGTQTTTETVKRDAHII